MNMDMDMNTMTMYFYSSTNVIYLSKESFHIETPGYYVLALFVTFAIAMGVEGLSYINYRCEFYAKKEMRQLVIDEDISRAKSRSLWFRTLQFAI